MKYHVVLSEPKERVTRDEINELIIGEMGLEDEGIILFDGMDEAFMGIAERFEPVAERIVHDDGGIIINEVGGTHRYFAVYSYAKMVAIMTSDGDLTDEDAQEYLEFNTVGLYAGPNTPAIMRDW